MNKLLIVFYTVMVIAVILTTSSPLQGAPVPGGPGFVSIGSLAFMPASQITTYSFIYNRIYNTSGSLAAFYAPVQLPHGATITQVVVYFVDNGGSDISAYLLSYPLDEPSNLTQMMYITTSGASANPRTLIGTTFPNGNRIDNQSNFYIVSVGLPPTSSCALGGVRIDYTYPISLPVVMK